MFLLSCFFNVQKLYTDYIVAEMNTGGGSFGKNSSYSVIYGLSEMQWQKNRKEKQSKKHSNKQPFRKQHQHHTNRTNTEIVDLYQPVVE